MRRRRRRNTKQDPLQINGYAKRELHPIIRPLCDELLYPMQMTITKISHTIRGVEYRMMITYSYFKMIQLEIWLIV